MEARAEIGGLIRLFILLETIENIGKAFWN